MLYIVQHFQYYYVNQQRATRREWGEWLSCENPLSMDGFQMTVKKQEQSAR